MKNGYVHVLDLQLKFTVNVLLSFHSRHDIFSVFCSYFSNSAFIYFPSGCLYIFQSHYFNFFYSFFLSLFLLISMSVFRASSFFLLLLPYFLTFLLFLSFFLSLYRFLSFRISCSKYHYIFIFVSPQTVSFILFSVVRSNVSLMKIANLGIMTIKCLYFSLISSFSQSVNQGYHY